MDVNKAVEVLKHHSQDIAPHRPDVQEALSVLEGLNIYGSRFKVGQQVWFVRGPQSRRDARQSAAVPSFVEETPGTVDWFWHDHTRASRGPPGKDHLE